MKPIVRFAVLAVAAFSLTAVFSDESDAQIFGRRRGGGGMGSQVCDMRTCPTPPGACASGSCNAQLAPAPAAPLAPPADVAPTAFTRKSGRKLAARGRHSFDLPEPPVSIASR